MMTRLYSNELKALVVPEDILTMRSVLQERFTTVQRLKYCCQRQRNNKGAAYGPTEPVELELTIRLNDPEEIKPYYERLTSNETFVFSFVFNAVFAENTNLKDYDDGMICEGYVVGIEEQFSTTRTTTPGDTRDLAPANQQMEVTIKLLLMNTTYIGRDNNFKSVFIN